MTYKNLSTEQLIRQWERAGETPDPKLIEEVFQREEEAKPLVLQIFHDSLSDNWILEEDPRWHRLSHAGRMLIAWREASAAPIFVTLYTDDAWDDVIEWFEVTIADLGPQALPEFLSILEKRINDWHYGVALAYSVVATIALRHPETREQVVTVLRQKLPPISEEVFQLAEQNEHLSWVWATIIGALADLNDEESVGHILSLFAAGLVSEDYYESADEYLEQLKSDPEIPPYYDIVSDYQHAYDFEQNWAKRHAAALRREQARARLNEASSQPKVGRNDPCPCGSGKKYKKCHGRPGL